MNLADRFFLPFMLFFIALNPLLQAKTVTVDYVVVGAGTAGAAVAKLLSDDKKTSVIALHSGENLNNDPLIKFSQGARIIVPAALLGKISPILTPPLYETGLTVPQPFADDRNLLWAIGLPEGGASSINAGAYCRGTNQLYAQWEAIAGPLVLLRILEVYKKLEHSHGKTLNPAFRGYHGPLSVIQAKPSVVRLNSPRPLLMPQAYLSSWIIMTRQHPSVYPHWSSTRKKEKMVNCASAAPLHF